VGTDGVPVMNVPKKGKKAAGVSAVLGAHLTGGGSSVKGEKSSDRWDSWTAVLMGRKPTLNAGGKRGHLGKGEYT